MPMLPTEFTLNLNEPIKPGKVTIGYFDGVHPSIVAVTRSDKIFVHNPHNRSVNDPLESELNVTNTSKLGSIQHGITTGINDINILNINQTITCIGTGSISSDTIPSSSSMNDQQDDISTTSAKNSTSIVSNIRRRIKKPQTEPYGGITGGNSNNDILLVGTKTSIHAYDIVHNTDLYYKEIPDGANTMVIGKFGQISGDLALIGGNCAIHGFDRNGTDLYWMVTGDNITAMALVDIDGDDQNELVIGSQDCEIQVFKKDAIIAEMSETDCITHLCRLSGQMFGYALANGTVGVYREKERLWRIKSKNQITCLYGYDVNNDGQMELLAGWSNGKLDIRIVATGEVLYRENYKNSVAGIMIADYNMDGRTELVICTVDGEVHGYRIDTEQDQSFQNININIEQETIHDLMKRKQALIQELRNYEENSRLQHLADPLVMNKGQMLNEKGENFGAIPADTKLKSSLILQSSTENGNPDYIELRLETTNQTKIRAAIVFAEGIFKYESIVVYPDENDVGNSIGVPLRPPKDVPVDLHVKAFVGYQSGTHYHVFELSRRLPRFAMYGFVRFVYLDEADNGKNRTQKESSAEAISQPESFVTITTNETITNITEWIYLNFLFDLQMEANEDERRFEFVSLRDQSSLIIEVRMSQDMSAESRERWRRKSMAMFRRNNESEPKLENLNDLDADIELDLVTTGGTVDEMPKNTVTIYSDSMEVAGNCIQSLAEHLELKNLPCHRGNFPEEIKKLRALVDRVEEIQSVRQHLVVEVADSASMIRASVVQAEDARLTEEYQRMKQIYNELAMLNRDIMREYNIRCQNHQDLVDSLKQINLIIQRASNLRLGTYKTAFINACREAIKLKNFVQLFKIINED